MPVEIGVDKKGNSKRVSRTIRVYGVESPIIASMTREGLQLRAAGSGKQTHLSASWRQIAEKMPLTPNAPARFGGDPIAVLTYLSAAALKARIRREEKKAKEKSNG